MKRRTALSLLATLALPKLGLSQEDGSAVLATSQNGFAIDLYRRLDKSAGNLFVSPYSIAAAVGMVYAGARGTTAEEIARALHLGALGADPKRAFLRLTREAPAAGGDGIIFESANALWGAERYPFNRDFIATIRSVFGGSLTAVDFANTVAAADTINGWVARKTEGRIQDLVSPTALNARTRLVLTNAVYFKAGWTRPFDTDETVTSPFHSDSGVKTVPMMNRGGYYDYATGAGVKLLALPYGQGGMNMIIILPDRSDGLADVEANLDAPALAGWVAAMQSTRARLALPKFKTESGFELIKPLRALGIGSAFSPVAADLTGIADVAHDRLYVSDAVQKTYIEVDENGTQAAAATGMMAAGAAIEPVSPPVPFIVDHPFLYLIQDTGTGRILFMGRVVDPSQGR